MADSELQPAEKKKEAFLASLDGRIHVVERRKR